MDLPKATEQILTEHWYPSGPTQTVTQEGDQDHPPCVAHLPASSSSPGAWQTPGPPSICPASGARQGRGGKPWSISSSSCWSPAAPASGNVLLSSERRRPDTGHPGPSPHPLAPQQQPGKVRSSQAPLALATELCPEAAHTGDPLEHVPKE